MHRLFVTLLVCAALVIPLGAGEERDAGASRELVKALSDPRFAVRQAAVRELVRAGAPAIPLVLDACQSRDRETAERAFEVLFQLSTATDSTARNVARTTLEELAASSAPELARRARLIINRRRRDAMRQLEAVGARIAGTEGRVSLIDLTGRPITNDHLALLAEFPEVESLWLRLTNVGDSGMQFVKALKNLEYLDLFGSPIGDEGLRHLKELPKLRSIPMGYTKVTDAGLAHLSAMTQLEYVGLRGDRVSDEGLAHLKGLANLTGLYLGETRVSDAGMVHLKGLTKLERLYVYDTQISVDGVNQLRQLFPNCQIITTNPHQ